MISRSFSLALLALILCALTTLFVYGACRPTGVVNGVMVRISDSTERPMPRFLVLEAEESLSLGKVPVYFNATRVVKASNVSGAAMHLEIVGASCSCIRGELDREVLLSGESATITIHIESRFPGGPQKHALRIRGTFDADGEKKEVVTDLAVSFEPERSYFVLPERPIHFQVCAGCDVRRTITLSFMREELPEITDVTFQDRDGNVLEGWEVEEIDSSGRWSLGRFILITLRGNWDEPGPHDGWCVIHSTDEVAPIYSIRIIGKVTPPASVSPRIRVMRVGEESSFEARGCGEWELVRVEVVETPDGVELVSSGERVVLRGRRAGSFVVPVRIVVAHREREIERVWEESVRLLVRAAGLDAD